VFRANLISRALGLCQDCRKPKVEWLTIHHCFYISGTAIWDHPEDLCLVLCWECHQKRQRAEEAAHVAVARLLRGEPIELLEQVAWNLLDGAARQERERGVE